MSVELIVKMVHAVKFERGGYLIDKLHTDDGG